jgi:hypothetical protein
VLIEYLIWFIAVAVPLTLSLAIVPVVPDTNVILFAAGTVAIVKSPVKIAGLVPDTFSIRTRSPASKSWLPVNVTSQMLPARDRALSEYAGIEEIDLAL